jgi:hypothetical protein
MNKTYAVPRSTPVLLAVPLLTGIYWLVASEGIFGSLLAFIPGLLLVGGAVMIWSTPGAPRAYSLVGLGALLGLLLGVPWLLMSGSEGLWALLGSAASALVNARQSVQMIAKVEGSAPVRESLKMDVKVALDEAVLGYFIVGAKMPSGVQAAEACDQARVLDDALAERGIYEQPERLHAAPPAPEPDSVESSLENRWGVRYEAVQFPSAFRADDTLPGGGVWNHLDANRQVPLRVVRHSEAGRPWILCIHGYRMGTPWMDFSLFGPGRLVNDFGVNVVMPVLPLHGSRRVGMRSGDFYLDGDPLDLFHAQCQALSDLRQTVAWIRGQDPQARIGVYGVSLGGYNAALLSNYEKDLDFVLSAIPVADFAETLWRVIPPAHQGYFTNQGLDEARYARVLGPVSPLSAPSRVAPDRRFVLAAAADRIVPPGQAMQLAAHWEVDPIWYQGSHLSIRRESQTLAALEQAVVAAGWRMPLR